MTASPAPPAASPAIESVHELPAPPVGGGYTLRAIVTGMTIGGLLSLCNIYAGLKIGWGFNMSVTAVLLSFGFWKALEKALGLQPWGIFENNNNQTAASAAASISSAGLVSAIPALTMITGETWGWPALVVWTGAVSLVGVGVATGLRKQLIEVDNLPFPGGIATAETLKEIYGKGTAAMKRVIALLSGAVVSGAAKVMGYAWFEVGRKLPHVPHLELPGTVTLAGAVAAKGTTAATATNLTFSIEPSLLLFGVGGLIGFRGCVSLLLGAAVAWGVIAPYALEQGWAVAGKPGVSWYGPLLKWLLWPGVAMMVTAALTSFAFSWRSVLAAVRGVGGGASQDEGQLSRKSYMVLLAIATVLAVACQVILFGIPAWAAFVGVAVTFVLALVAGRVSGEAGITPVGAMGKVTQLLFGVLTPGNAAANLMAANVTGGAASQCGDLLHDLKTGKIIGAPPKAQVFAQIWGVLAGAVCGSAGYLILVPDPKKQLLTDAWPAPAVASWKAVAEIFQTGLSGIPGGAVEAMAIAGVAGIVLALAEKLAPKSVRAWVPSPASLGLAFVIPAYNAVSIFLGGLLAVGLQKVAPQWSKNYLITTAAGLVAGESLMGVLVALHKLAAG